MSGRKYFFSSTKKGKTGDDGKKSEDHITFKYYLMCENICDKFDIKDMGDYHDDYLKKDVLLLADVFEKFIDMCLKFYGFDPYHYFSSPGLSWDAILKMTGVKLEKISDIDNFLFVKKGLRGGISYIFKRYAKVNKKYTNDYDPNKPLRFITYLAMNNLYSWKMSECLPYGKFKWLKNVNGFDVDSIGYVLEVDLEYPDELHALHNDYLLGSEKLAVSSDVL